MAGLDVAVAAAAAAGKILSTQGAYDFFFKWKHDESLLDRLKAQVNITKELLKVAEMRQIQKIIIEDEWFKNARFAICDAEDVMEKIITDVQQEEYRMGDSPGTGLIVKEKLRFKGKDIVRSVHPFKKTREAEMNEIIQKLQSIVSQVSNLGLNDDAEIEAIRQARGESTSSVNDTIKICGRLEDKRNIMKLLDSTGGVDDALRVIFIVGLAGVGKTTLAAMIFQECRSLSQSFFLPSLIPRKTQMEEDTSLQSPEFDVKVWVCLSDKFEVKDVIKSILESITKRSPELDGLGSLVEELKKELYGKKFLLILDDFWNEDSEKWDKLVTPFLVGKPGSRIIVTTRSKDVAEIMTSVPGVFYQLNVMSKEASWSLFESVAFPNGSEGESPALKEIGRGIVDKCKGLPLAIKMIGGLLLSYRNDVIKWKTVLNSKVWSSTHKILPSLWLSYYHLPPHVQQCFAYFSLFPKDYEFEMEEMVMLWVAEGFIERTSENELHEDVARGYFGHLLLNFFIQESSSGGLQFVLHDLVHDLAEYVSMGLYVDLLDIDLQSHRLSIIKGKDLQSRRLSFIKGKDEVLLYKLKVQKLRRLRTFLPLTNFHTGRYFGRYLDHKILSDMLSNFKLLRVLSLEGYFISVLPASVGDMKLLRYLDISHTDIECLPLRICCLYNLQFLNLYGCQRLKRLPMNIGDLVNLRYLNVGDTDLEEMPYGIGRMKNLQMLPKLVLRKEKSKQMKELKDLNNLHGKLQISGLHNITDKEYVVGAQFGKKEYLEKLVLEWEKIEARDTTLDESVLDGIQAHENLKKLTVSWYGGKRLSTWIVGMTPSSNIMLRSFSIYNCFNLETLPPLGNLLVLEILKIKDMKMLETWSFPGGGGRGFPSLKELRIVRCPMLTSMPFCFPSLTVLKIDGCGNVFGSKMCSGGPSLGSLCLLKELSIVGLHGLEFLDDGFYGNDCCDVVFPVLQKLEIRDMEVLTTWSLPGGIRQGFPSLKELRIISCPTLKNIPLRFPSLTVIEIYECGNLFGSKMCNGGPSLGSLCLLKELSFMGLECLEFLDDGFYGNDCCDVVFPALEKLEIRYMEVLTTWSCPGGNRQRFTLLKELRIQRCPELTKFPICFPSLTSLQIQGCHKLFGPEMCGGPSLGNLPALKYLRIKGLLCLQSLNEGFYGDDCDAPFFPALEKFDIGGMDVLKTWCFPRGERRREFPLLKELRISSCPELTKIPYCFPCLTKLDIFDCLDLSVIEMIGGERGSVSKAYGHSLLSIDINKCPKLEEIPKSFVNLMNVDCYDCDKLVSLPRLQNVQNVSLGFVSVSLSLKAAIQDSTYLEKLVIWSRDGINVAVELSSLDLNHLSSLKCLELTIRDDGYEGIGWENDDQVGQRQPPNLSHLHIYRCNLQMISNILTHFANLNAPLTNLEFNLCEALESFPDVELPSTLLSLEITSCHALNIIPDSFLSGCSRSLEELTIYNCPNLVCLPGSISTFKSFQKIDLSDCEVLESLPDGFHNAIALQTLTLRNCPNLVVLKECVFPTALTHLTIRDCGKMTAVSKLKLPKLTSLTHLELEGFPETFTLEAGSLPESIEKLTIRNFPHLRSLSGLLPTLKNLKWLDVDRCPLVNKKPLSKMRKLIPQQFKSCACNT